VAARWKRRSGRGLGAFRRWGSSPSFGLRHRPRTALSRRPGGTASGQAIEEGDCAEAENQPQRCGGLPLVFVCRCHLASFVSDEFNCTVSTAATGNNPPACLLRSRLTGIHLRPDEPRTLLALKWRPTPSLSAMPFENRISTRYAEPHRF
jgi:hypothetical protein